MQIQLIGLNHKTAPIEIREQFYLSENKRDLYLSELKSHPEVVEAFVLSTCNRTEIYVHTIDQNIDMASYVYLLSKITGVEFTHDMLDHFYHFNHDAALRHLFEVSAGLDSLVLGEKQILGQIKMAFDRAKERGILGRNFNILANTTIRVGKKARAETDIDVGGSSVSWAAIRKAEKEFGSLEDKTVLMIGAGEMSELAVGQVHSKGFKKLYLMNRTPEHAEKLASQFDGECVGFCDIKEILSKVDLCVCSSSAPHYILDRATVEKSIHLRGNRPLLFIDISMPRNLDPDIDEIDNIKLCCIDDLKMVVEKNMKLREEAIGDVRQIIEDKISEYHHKLNKASEYSTIDLLESV